jgi:hypothetical protein
MEAITDGEWVDEVPPRVTGDVVWGARLEELAKQPGRTKKYGPYAAASILRSVKNAVERSTTYAEGDFRMESRTTTNEDGTHSVWAYVTYTDTVPGQLL